MSSSLSFQGLCRAPGCEFPPRPLCVQVLQVNSLIQTQKSAELAAALLSVYVERAEDLPVRAAPHTHSSLALPAPSGVNVPRGLGPFLSEGGAGVGRLSKVVKVMAVKWKWKHVHWLWL